MFSSMFKYLHENSLYTNKIDNVLPETIEIARKNVQSKLEEIVFDADNDKNMLTITIDESFENMSIADTASDIMSKYDSEDILINSKKLINDTSFNKENDKYLTVTNINNKIKSLQCMFTWNLKHNIATKDVITCIINKYGEQSLDMSIPEFTLEKYMGNIILCFELFHKNEYEIANTKILEMSKWLEELDSGNNEFYLSIRFGLKHVLLSTYVHILFITNSIDESKWLLNDIIPFECMEYKSKAAIYAIRASVLIEYGCDSKDFKMARKSMKKACSLDPTTWQWLYIHSLVHMASRHFLFGKDLYSNPTKQEKDTIQQAISLANEKNCQLNFHSLTLEWDSMINNFHCSKTKISMENDSTEVSKVVIEIIQKIIDMESNNPYLVVMCKRTLMTVPLMVHDKQLGEQIMMKALQMAPNDLTLQKAIAIATEVFNEINIVNGCSIDTTLEDDQSLLEKDLKLIVEHHKQDEDAIPYLTELLKKYDGFNMWIILAQICSYTILFKKNLKAGLEYFMMMLTEQKDISTSDLITLHCSVFTVPKKFNLAELISNEIRLATNLTSISLEDMFYNMKVLYKIMEVYQLKLKCVDPFMCANLVSDSLSKINSTQKEYDQINGNIANDVDKKQALKKRKTRSHKPKCMLTVGAKLHTKKLESSKKLRQEHYSKIITQNCVNTINLQGKKLKQSRLSFNSRRASNIKKINFKMLIKNNLGSSANVIKNHNVDIRISTFPKNETSPQLYRSLATEFINKNTASTQIMYTDASKTLNGVGISIVHNRFIYKFKIHDNCSSFTAEAIAIRIAIGIAKLSNGSSFKILSDALSVLNRIRDNHTSDPTIIGILAELKTCNKPISFIWVPGHCGILGNEKANKAANEATKLSEVTKTSTVSDFNKAIILAIKNKMTL